MTAERIEFSLIHGNEELFPRPYPATRDIPEWIKAMPIEAEGEGNLRTVKNCPPFIEAMTCGYIIPLSADISLSIDPAGGFSGQGPTWVREADYAKMVSFHAASQVKGSPFEKSPVVKILNPWLIRTPPGYSTLFLSLLNRFLMPLFPLAGLVETDIFYRNVNFPAVLTIPPGTTLSLPRGTPLVQVIPIKRDEFQAEVVPLEVDKFNAIDKNTAYIPENASFYKDNYWRKKSYR